MFLGSTVDISVSCSSVVRGWRVASHCSLVMPSGWVTQALPHSWATSSASSAGGADVGFEGTEVILVGRLLVAPPVAPGVVGLGQLDIVVVLLPVVSAAAPRGL